MIGSQGWHDVDTPATLLVTPKVRSTASPSPAGVVRGEKQNLRTPLCDSKQISEEDDNEKREDIPCSGPILAVFHQDTRFQFVMLLMT